MNTRRSFWKGLLAGIGLTVAAGIMLGQTVRNADPTSGGITGWDDAAGNHHAVAWLRNGDELKPIAHGKFSKER